MNELTQRLRRVDGSAPTIQAAAAELMRHYDTTAPTAVLEWRNALFRAQPDQIVPLLYVANEVLQNSRRNRGNKYLDAFTPILPQSLEYMGEQLQATGTAAGREQVEKIRRTVKIWGQRQVYSVRIVNELLSRLERYRHAHRGGETRPVAAAPDRPQVQREPQLPQHHDVVDDKKRSPSSNDGEEIDPDLRFDDSDHDDDDNNNMQNTTKDGHDEAEGDDDDDDDLFASDDDDGPPKLEIDVKIGDSAIDHHSSSHKKQEESSSTKKAAAAARKRSPSKLSPSAAAAARRLSVLSSANMVDLWNQLAEVQQEADLKIQTLRTMRSKVQAAAADQNHLSTLVGDKLQLAAQLNHRDKLQILTYRRQLFQLAQSRHVIEQQAVRYYHWLAQSIETDHGDLDMADTVEAKLEMWAPIAEQLVAARYLRRQRERESQVADERKRQQQREEAEAAAFRAAALAKETEAKPGMVWNPTTREYQALNTDESWRD
jgi:hypothetical protein